MTTTSLPLTPTQSQWSERITAWEMSGLNQSSFCKQHGLVYGTFVYWRSHLKKLNADVEQPESISFFPVTLKSEKTASLILRVNDQHSIELKSDFNPELLAKVVQVIQQIA
jgi:hypothetical protein